MEFAVVLAVAALAGCASAPRATTAPAPQPIYYPPPPAEPRLQFLARFSSVRDVASPQSAFQDFVLGKDTDAARLVEKPYGVALRDGRIYVVDTRRAGYGIFDVAAGGTRFIQPHGQGALRKPISIALDAAGRRYVSDAELGQVLVYDTEDRFMMAYGAPGQFKPAGIAVAGEQLYVADVEHHALHVLDTRSGATLRRLGTPGSGPGQLFQPTNVAVGPDGAIYVTDTGNFRIQKFAADGTFVRAFGSVGTTPGRFARPKGVALDREGRLYVVDAAFENLQVLDPEGAPLLFFGAPGDGPADLNLPATVALDYGSVESFRRYAAPGFEIEYVVLVANQFGPNAVVAYGFGVRHESTTAAPPTGQGHVP
jgi:sugar lactone lactonase YvrE